MLHTAAFKKIGKIFMRKVFQTIKKLQSCVCKFPFNLLLNTDIISCISVPILCKNKDDINHSSAANMFKLSKMTSKVNAIKITRTKTSIYT